jgi:hypothetical protein
MTATAAAIGPTRARPPERLAATRQAPTSASTLTAPAVIPHSVGAAPPNSNTVVKITGGGFQDIPPPVSGSGDRRDAGSATVWPIAGSGEGVGERF